MAEIGDGMIHEGWLDGIGLGGGFLFLIAAVEAFVKSLGVLFFFKDELAELVGSEAETDGEGLDGSVPEKGVAHGGDETSEAFEERRSIRGGRDVDIGKLFVEFGFKEFFGSGNEFSKFFNAVSFQVSVRIITIGKMNEADGESSGGELGKSFIGRC